MDEASYPAGALITLGVLAALMVVLCAFLAAQSETRGPIPDDARFRDDIVQLGLQGFFFAQVAAVVVGASFRTTEYGSGLIRTTLMATPSRLRVFGAKAVVRAGATFPIALGASAIGFVIAQSRLRENGYVAPAYPPVSLSDAHAARAIVGTAGTGPDSTGMQRVAVGSYCSNASICELIASIVRSTSPRRADGSAWM